MVFSRREMDAMRINSNNPSINDIFTTEQGSSAVQIANTAYVISIDSNGLITAYVTDPNLGLTNVTGTDIGAVINSCVTLLLPLPGYSTIGILPSTAIGSSYPALTTIDGQSAISIVALGELENNRVYIDFSGSTGLTDGIINCRTVQGIGVGLANNMNGITAVNILNCRVDANNKGGFSFKTSSSTSYCINCLSGGNTTGLEVTAVRTVVFGFSSNGDTNGIVIDSGATGCRIIGVTSNGTTNLIVDNSTGVNIIEGVQTGVLTSPAVTNSATPNTFGTKVEVIISIDTTATKITKNATDVFQSTALTPACVTVTLNAGESITLDQTTGVSWKWFAI